MSEQEQRAVDLMTKNWDVIQELLERVAKMSWNVKIAVGVVWWTVVGFEVTHGARGLFPAVVGLLLLGLVYDASIKSSRRTAAEQEP